MAQSGQQDYAVWKSNFGTNYLAADGNGDGIVDAADYTVWRNHFGTGAGSSSAASAPEPGGIALVMLAALVAMGGFDRGVSPSRLIQIPSSRAAG